MNASDLIEHYELIRDLRADGFGRVRIAAALRERGIHVAPHVIQTVIYQMEREDRIPVKVERGPLDAAAEDEPIEDWLSRRAAVSRRKIAKHAKSARTITLPPEPIAIAVMGDPHLDNDGCDYTALLDDVALFRDTPGVLVSCVGDVHDNWIGRLARCYANSSATASEGWRASRWLLQDAGLQFLAIVGGNHDAWAHGPGIDPLRWLSDECGVTAYDADELRLTLAWKDRPDLDPIVWILRHDFPGRSLYHPTHGVHREAIFDGRAHLLTAGHIHQWGTLVTEQRHGRVTHAVRVRGYKRADAYARQRGFYEQRHGRTCLVVIDPLAEEPGRLQTWWDLPAGCAHLTRLRASRAV